jgi:hypothetical protein
MTMKDYFSMLKSSVMLECPAGLLIRVQPNTYIEKTEHFQTSLHLVKERRWLNKGYNTQEVWEIQPSFASVYCVVSGLHNKLHWQDFPSNQSIIKVLVKCKTKQSCLRTFSASRGPHLIPGELLSVTEQDALFEDLLKEHVDRMEQPKLLKELIHQIKDNKLLSNRGNMARTSGINGSKNNKARANDEVTRPLPLEGTTKEDIMQMVEATAMVYKVMEEQHKIDSLVPKEPTIVKDEMHLNEFALQLCRTHGMPECDTNGCPANIFEMNTSIATLSVQCGDENSLYHEGKSMKPQCFSCHVDDKNDPEYRDVWVIYKHVQDPNSHLWFCVRNVFTYCKSCGDYMKRLSNGRFLKECQLGPYLEHYRLRSHLSQMLDDFHPIEYKDKPLQPIPRLPFFDKVAGCMSLPIDSSAVLINHYQWERNLQKIVEITTPIGWVHGFVNYPKVMKKWRRSGLPPDDWGHNGNLTVAYVMECLQMFGGLNMGKFQQMTPFINYNLTVEHCLQTKKDVYKTICDILQNEDVDNNGEVTYHAASIKLIVAYLWKGILAQHILYLLGGLSVIPARFCADSEICVGTDAHKKVKGLLPLASLNKCLHDLAKEQKLAPMVVECVN